ncbi:hypothetical protein V2G26_007192 [Clonostachys chloroleuca]
MSIVIQPTSAATQTAFIDKDPPLLYPSKMSFKREELDSRGDTLIILPAKRNPQVSSAQARKLETVGLCHGYHFLCSKKHLTSASPRADKMFSSGFKEAIPEDDDGLFHWTFEPIFDPDAFKIVMKIIHGKTRDIARTVTVTQLAQISAIVDDLECYEALWFFAKGWLFNLRSIAALLNGEDIARLILIAFVFDEPALFES